MSLSHKLTKRHMKGCKKSCRKNGSAKVNAQTQKELNTLPVSTAKTTGAQYAGKQKAPGKNVTKKGIQDFFQNKGLASVLGRAARKLGFVRREGNFRPLDFLVAIITAVGLGTPMSLSKINEFYNLQFGGSMENKPFWNRISSDGCLSLFLFTLDQIQEKFALQAEKCPYREGIEAVEYLKARGLDIEDIRLFDGTYFKVQGELEDRYPGTRSTLKEVPLEDVFDENGNRCADMPKNACIGFQASMSMKTGNLTTFIESAETDNEKEYVLVDLLHRYLYLMDSGYYQYNLLQRIIDAGSYFLTKGRKNCAAVIKECSVWGTQRNGDPTADSYVGMKVSDALIKVRDFHQSIDMNVECPNGMKLRMVAFWNKKDDQAVLLVTNIHAQQVPPSLLTDVYRIRWQIELLFKNLKSGNNLRMASRSANLNVLHTLLISSIIAFLLKSMTGNMLSQVMKNVSFYKLHVNNSWLPKFVTCFFKGNAGKMKDLIKTLLSNKKKFQKSVQSKRKFEEYRTFESVLNSLRKSLMPTWFVEPQRLA